MSSKEIEEAINKACNADKYVDELALLAGRLQHVESSVVFHTLFQFAIHSQEIGPASPAAWLLRRVNPPCPISCQNAVEGMLQDWDISIEEVPFYLAEQFGINQVLSVVEDLNSKTADHNRATYLDTIRYWIECYQNMKNSSL